jgi:predicted amidohydrolase
MQAVLLFLLAGGLYASGAVPDGWRTWAPRAEIAPRTFVEGGALAISGNGISGEHGGWERDIPSVESGAWYRFTARYKCVGVPYESMQVLPRVDWKTSTGKRAGRPDYPYRTTIEGAWTRVTADVQAPTNASTAILQLYLFNAPQGTVWWRDAALERVPAPSSRPVTIASLNLRPSGTKLPAESVRRFVAGIDKAIPGKVDLIVLPEGITVIGTGKSYVDVSEAIPGPTTATLAEVAKRRHAYIVAGIYEREGAIVYNTAVLLDRAGNVAGKYRKVYLPSSEVEGGLTPGTDFPVFQTDFGTLGLMICYDVFFSDPAHALARQGAEIVAMPIWGGDETLAKARAIENKIFLVASGYDHPTYVMDPTGERVASAAQGEAAIATVDLGRRYWDPQLGDMKARRMKEERVDVRMPGR